MIGEWQRGRWWRVIEADGTLWGETSSEKEAREMMGPGRTLQKLFIREEREWRDVE